MPSIPHRPRPVPPEASGNAPAEKEPEVSELAPLSGPSRKVPASLYPPGPPVNPELAMPLSPASDNKPQVPPPKRKRKGFGISKVSVRNWNRSPDVIAEHLGL